MNKKLGLEKYIAIVTLSPLVIGFLYMFNMLNKLTVLFLIIGASLFIRYGDELLSEETDCAKNEYGNLSLKESSVKIIDTYAVIASMLTVVPGLFVMFVPFIMAFGSVGQGTTNSDVWGSFLFFFLFLVALPFTLFWLGRYFFYPRRKVVSILLSLLIAFCGFIYGFFSIFLQYG